VIQQSRVIIVCSHRFKTIPAALKTTASQKTQELYTFSTDSVFAAKAAELD
jgi:hypothetical protein